MYEWFVAYVIGAVLSIIILVVSYFMGILMPLLMAVGVILGVFGIWVLFKSEDEPFMDPLFSGIVISCIGSVVGYLQGPPLISILFSSLSIITVWFILKENRFTMVFNLYKLYCKLTFTEYKQYKLFSNKLPNRQRRLLELGTGISDEWLEIKLYDYLRDGYYIRWINEESIGIIRIENVDDIINENNSSIMSKIRNCYICGEEADELYENMEMFMASSINKGTPYMCSTCVTELQHVIIDNTDIDESDIVARKI